MRDIVKRLRDECDVKCLGCYDQQREEAADLIERLTAELSELRDNYEHQKFHATTAEGRAAVLTAERDALREAAHRVVDDYPVAAGTVTVWTGADEAYGSIKALRLVLNTYQQAEKP